MTVKVLQSDFDKLATERIIDAEALYEKNRYEGAIYLCGYALEYSLKSQICKHNGWAEFTPLKETRTFTTHDLDELLKLSGKEKNIQNTFNEEWLFIKGRWNPTNRYLLSSTSPIDCRSFIDNTESVIKEIQKI